MSLFYTHAPLNVNVLRLKRRKNILISSNTGLEIEDNEEVFFSQMGCTSKTLEAGLKHLDLLGEIANGHEVGWKRHSKDKL